MTISILSPISKFMIFFFIQSHKCFGNLYLQLSTFKWEILKQSIWWTSHEYFYEMIDIWFRSKHVHRASFISKCCARLTYNPMIYLTLTFVDCSFTIWFKSQHNTRLFCHTQSHTHPSIISTIHKLPHEHQIGFFFHSNRPRNVGEWKSTMRKMKKIKKKTMKFY